MGRRSAMLLCCPNEGGGKAVVTKAVNNERQERLASLDGIDDVQLGLVAKGDCRMQSCQGGGCKLPWIGARGLSRLASRTASNHRPPLLVTPYPETRNQPHHVSRYRHDPSQRNPKCAGPYSWNDRIGPSRIPTYFKYARFAARSTVYHGTNQIAS